MSAWGNIFFFHTISECNRWIFSTWSWMKQKIIHYIITFHRHRNGVVRNSIYRMLAVECKHKKCLLVFMAEGKKHLSCSLWAASQTPAWYYTHTHAHTHRHSHTHTHKSAIPTTSHFLCGICNGCVTLSQCIFLFLLTAWVQFIFLSGDGGGW